LVDLDEHHGKSRASPANLLSKVPQRNGCGPETIGEPIELPVVWQGETFAQVRTWELRAVRSTGDLKLGKHQPK
jgi:hypothetical protein